ncbi:alpha/beta-hydrolase [Cerioporus squamosus]|nr:alpha/beta-hydrolase [Cerioporus squamosus]
MYPLLTSILLISIAGHSSCAAAPLAPTGSQIRWGPCDQFGTNDTSLACGFFDVPLDYHNIFAGTARLAVIKVRATGPRRGSVFVNYGGPGEPGVQDIIQYKDDLLSLTGGVYDVVSWDPRGVGNLTIPGEIYCFDSAEDHDAFFKGTIELTGIDENGNFTDPAEIAALLAQASPMQKKYSAVGQKCLHGASGRLLRYVGTAAAVRDIVSMADALDGPRAPINFIGYSFGTVMGAWLVNMFPQRVGRVILDGVLDPVFLATHDLSVHWDDQLVSADTVYKGMITGCALAGPGGCAAASQGDGPLDIDAKFQALIQAAHDAAKANASIPLTSGQIHSLLRVQMYYPEGWRDFLNEVYPDLVETVKSESPPSAHLQKRLDDVVPPRTLEKRVQNDAPSYTPHAIICGDAIDPGDTTIADIFKDLVAGTQNVSHMFGAVWPIIYPCPFWPVRSVERYTGPFNKKLANKILIASNTYDPITSLRNAQALAALLGDDAVLLRLNGFGHQTLSAPSACVDEVMARYLVNGTLPEKNTVCEVNADFELFDGVNTADILANLPASDI